jgi:hypothetical protein
MATGVSAPEETLKRAKGTAAQTIFDPEMEAIMNFHIVTPLPERIPGISTVSTQNGQRLAPTGPSGITPPNNINEHFDYFEYYSNIPKSLGSDTYSD